MSEDDIFWRTGSRYLRFIHPLPRDAAWRMEIAPVIALAPEAPDNIVASMVVGENWRERLLGLCLAMAKQSGTFTESMIQSLQDPRGIAIVPTCAALAVLAQAGVFNMTPSFSETLERGAFDGEIGWAVDKTLHVAGLSSTDVSGRGPNYGQCYEDHLELFSWIHAAGRRDG